MDTERKKKPKPNRTKPNQRVEIFRLHGENGETKNDRDHDLRSSVVPTIQQLAKSSADAERRVEREHVWQATSTQ